MSAAGRLTLAYKGKSVTHLKPGKYKFVVTDKSSSNGFLRPEGEEAHDHDHRRRLRRQALRDGRPHRRQVARPAEAGKASYSIVVS